MYVRTYMHVQYVYSISAIPQKFRTGRISDSILTINIATIAACIRQDMAF